MQSLKNLLEVLSKLRKTFSLKANIGLISTYTISKEIHLAMLSLEAETPFSLTVNIVKEFSSDYENLFYFVSFHFQVVV